METSVLSHVTNSVLVVYVLQWLKGTATYRRFASALPVADTKVHVLMSALGAAGSALGMHGTAKGSYAEGWTLVLAIPPLWILAHAAWDLGQQMALNQLIFAITVQQKAAAPVATVQTNVPKVSVTVPLEEKV